MTQDSYNNYVNIVRARADNLVNITVEALKRGDYKTYLKNSYDLAILEASLELMEEYDLPIKILIGYDGYVQPNFLTYIEMQEMNSLVQKIINTNFQIEFLLDTPDGFIIDDDYNPILTSSGNLLISGGGETGPVFLKDALKQKVNVDFVYASTGYKLDGGNEADVLTSDTDGLATFEESQGGSSGLDYEIQSTLDVGGIEQGDIFLDQSKITDLLRDLLVGLDIKDLTVSGNYYIEVTKGVLNPTLNWVSVGMTPSNQLMLTTPTDDGAFWPPLLDVTGMTTYNYSKTFIMNNPGTLEWKVQASTGEFDTTTKQWVYPSFYGKNATGSLPTEVDLIDKVLTDSSFGVTFPLRTANNEYGWFAVPKVETGRIYTKWDASSTANPFNKGDIGDTSLVSYKTTLTNIGVNNITYDIYQFNYASELITNIKLL